jgi:phosphatidylglycerol:prolipoprotein diacylglycerol transferase
MRQVLFHVPFINLPVYGYGLMLFVAFVGCGWLGARLAKREGINPAHIPDLIMWLFIGGLLGARIVYIYEDWHTFAGGPWLRFFTVWDGGLTFYGSMFGGVLAYYLYYYRFLRQEGVSNWKMADVAAPCLALGACLGRIGCLLTGCCFGAVACPDCPALQFPVPNGPNVKLIDQGLAAPLGLLLESDGRVRRVEAGAPAQQAGVAAGDVILEVNGHPIDVIRSPRDDSLLRVTAHDGLRYCLTYAWPRGEQHVVLRVRHADGRVEELPPFRSWSLGVYPTQIFESVSMALLLFFLLAYHPFKSRDGALMVFVMLGYGVHRYLNEMLRSDNEITATGLTLSQNISIAILVGAAVLGVLVWRRPTPAPEPAQPASVS